MTPVPGMLSQMVAALSFNVAGLDLYSPECFNEKVFFVGPCYPPVSSSIPVSNERDEIKEWLDEAQAGGEEVVYVNFGSIFYVSKIGRTISNDEMEVLGLTLPLPSSSTPLKSMMHSSKL